jgi:hypothetical protein
MSQFGGKPDTKRHFTVVMGGKEHGLYVSSTPSSAAKKAVTKLCAANKSKKVEFYIREITQGSKKKTYGPYLGFIEKLKEPIELKGRVIRYKPVAKLSGKTSEMKGGGLNIKPEDFFVNYNYRTANNKPNGDPKFKYSESTFGTDKIFFGKKISLENSKKYFSIVLASDGSFGFLTIDPATKQFKTYDYDKSNLTNYFQNNIFPRLDEYIIPNPDNVHKIKFSDKMKEQLDILRKLTEQLKQKLEQQKLEQQKIEQDKNKIILKSFKQIEGSDDDIYLTFLFKGEEITNNMNNIKSKNSYLFFNETTKRPIGDFEHFIYSDIIKNIVINILELGQKIVIKIGENGTVADLFSYPSLKESNLLANSRLNKNSFNKMIGIVENFLTPKENNE